MASNNISYKQRGGAKSFLCTFLTKGDKVKPVKRYKIDRVIRTQTHTLYRKQLNFFVI